MEKIKVSVHGLGNIGKYVIEAVEASTDIECIGVVRRAKSIGTNKLDLRSCSEFPSLAELQAAKGKPDVALICTPSRHAFEDDSLYIQQGINTVDSFDIHEEIPSMVEKLGAIAKNNKCVAITAAGWDPGTDSVFRALFQAMVPVGTTFTNFGRGRSMGHSAAARAIKGVADAISITIPMGGGRHSRLVYVILEKGESLEEVKARIAADAYFAKDPLEVRSVPTSGDLALVCDASHGVLMERTGASGFTANQKLSFDMRIDNPALTAQIMVSCARASVRLEPGSYTMIDIPPVALLHGGRMSIIKQLV